MPRLTRGRSGSFVGLALVGLLLTGCPHVSDVEPSPAQPGDLVEIRGIYFGVRKGESRVLLGEQPLDVTFWTDRVVRARVPAEMPPGDYALRVELESGRSADIRHRIVERPPPTGY